jgi:hypothetical protein
MALDALARDAARLKASELAGALQRLTFIERTLPRYMGGTQAQSEAHLTWVRDAETLLVQLAVPAAGREFEAARPDSALALEALRVLEGTSMQAGVHLLLSVKTWLGSHRGRSPADQDLAWFAACHETLRSLGTPGLAPWLAERIEADSTRKHPAVLSALVALAGLDQAPGMDRLLATRTLVEDKGIAQRLGPSGHAFDLLLAIEALAGSEAVEDVSAAVPGGIRADLGDVRRWLRKHLDVRRPPWSGDG